VELKEIVSDVANALVNIDRSGLAFRGFQKGVGPHGEPQLVKLIATALNHLNKYRDRVRTKRTPDLLIPSEWAIEFKITRPFGDNGKEAENWSVNLLHPYPGNLSTIGDCMKLLNHSGTERRAIIVIGYEHVPAQIDLTPLLESFEAIAANVLGIDLAPRIETRHERLVHPVHQAVRVIGWEVLGRASHSQN